MSVYVVTVCVYVSVPSLCCHQTGDSVVLASSDILRGVVPLLSMNINVHFNSQQGPERPLLLDDIFQSMLITKHGGMRALYQESSTSASNQ